MEKSFPSHDVILMISLGLTHGVRKDSRVIHWKSGEYLVIIGSELQSGYVASGVEVIRQAIPTLFD